MTLTTITLTTITATTTRTALGPGIARLPGASRSIFVS